MINHLQKFLLLSVFFLALILPGCAERNVPTLDVSQKSTEELILLLKDPNDPYNAFREITSELGKRGSMSSDAAPALAIALTYPRRDSYLAGFALISIGPSGKSATPILYSQLNDKRDSVRRYSALSLGAIGKSAACAIPALAKLLWHTSPETRAASAISIDSITGLNLVQPEAKLDPQFPGIMPTDDPEGTVSKFAREWWLKSGKNETWPVSECLQTE